VRKLISMGRGIIKTKIESLENQIDSIKQDMWKSTLKIIEYNKKCFPHKKRIENVSIELIRLTSKRDILNEVIKSYSRGKTPKP